MAVLATITVVGLTPSGVQHGALAGVLTAAALTDGRRGIVPNGLVLGAVLLAVGIRGVQGTPPVEILLPGGGVFGVLLAIRGWSLWVFGRAGLGMGDVKLGLALGLFLGWPAFWALYLAATLGAVFGSIGLLMGRIDRTTRLPFAPCIALGTLLHAFVPFPL